LHPVQAADMSMVVIPSVRLSADLKKDRPVRSTDFATGENGDGGRYRDLGTSTTSTGVQGFLGVLVPGVPSFATGFDALGDGSLVSLGIDGLFVASVTPTPGESDVNALDALAWSSTRTASRPPSIRCSGRSR